MTAASTSSREPLPPGTRFIFGRILPLPSTYGLHRYGECILPLRRVFDANVRLDQFPPHIFVFAP